ncbi:hypothetical protein MTR67_019457 [Solanum verrucosum]|uniref:Uncharacterized protein n=1 Tax=Solanum verrucosum TaxID=315347 RepID=A0AAF0QNS3_SOLVR|nr:hypothetical protein MTR67_019457 [Solanum verrucosum]
MCPSPYTNSHTKPGVCISGILKFLKIPH